MEWFNQLLAENYLYALGWMLIHALWQIAGIGLLLWLALKIFSSKSPGFKYKLSFAALLLIPLLSISTFLFHLENTTQASSDFSAAMLSEALLSQQIPEPVAQEALVLSWRNEIEKYIPSLVNIWFIGVILFMIRLASSLADIRQLHQKKHFPLEERIMQFGVEKCRQLGISHAVQILQSTSLDTPITYGILKPVVLIPTSLLLHISPAQLEAIIAHELAHIKRYDYAFNLIQRITEVVFFFHPVFWWINTEIRKHREMACDELAVSSGIAPTDLAYGLATVLNHAQQQIPEMAMAAGKKANPTLDRIKRIMGIKTDITQPTTLTSITMILTLLIGATLIVSAEREPLKQDLLQENIEQGFDQAASDTTRKQKTQKEESNFKVDDSGKIIILDTVRDKKATKIYMDSLFSRGRELTPEEIEELQITLGEPKNWPMPFKGLDFDFEVFSNMPMLKLHEMPMPDFGDMPKFEFEPETFEKMLPGPEFYENLPRIIIPRDSANIYRMPVLPFHMDTTNMDKEKMEQFKKELKENTAAFRIAIQAQNEERKARIQEWKSEHHEELAEWQEKQKEWTEKNGAKIREWSEQNQPLIEEYKIKIQKWQEENEPQLEEYKKEMEEWRKNYEAEMMELKKQLKEMQLKMKDQKENQ